MDEILTVFGVNWKLLVIQMVNFGVLLLVLWRFLYQPLLRALENRRVKIAQGLEDAEKAEMKLKQIEEEKEGNIRQSLIEGEDIVKKAKHKAQAQEKTKVQEAHEHSSKIIAEAQKTAQDEKEKILAETQKEIAKTAILAAEKILESR